jgi:hypothetical protein
MSRHCSHMASIRDVTPSARGREECLKRIPVGPFAPTPNPRARQLLRRLAHRHS